MPDLVKKLTRIELAFDDGVVGGQASFDVGYDIPGVGFVKTGQQTEGLAIGENPGSYTTTLEAVLGEAQVASLLRIEGLETQLEAANSRIAELEMQQVTMQEALSKVEAKAPAAEDLSGNGVPVEETI